MRVMHQSATEKGKLKNSRLRTPAQPKNAARRASPRSWIQARSELQQRPILWNLDALLDAFFLDIGS